MADNIVSFQAKGMPALAVAEVSDELLLAWLEIANGREPAHRDLVALLVRMPPQLSVGLALGLQMAANAHPSMNGTLPCNPAARHGGAGRVTS
jgi:hypothetical protein